MGIGRFLGGCVRVVNVIPTIIDKTVVTINDDDDRILSLPMSIIAKVCDEFDD